MGARRGAWEPGGGVREPAGGAWEPGRGHIEGWQAAQHLVGEAQAGREAGVSVTSAGADAMWRRVMGKEGLHEKAQGPGKTGSI